MNHNNKIRAFIAIPIPTSIQTFLSNVINNIKFDVSENSIKWVEPKNIHITLKFLGDISDYTKDKLLDGLKSNFHSVFNLEINKIGAFPSIYKPRVIWVGLSKSTVLENLASYIQETTDFIQKDEKIKSFSPHLTIARIKPGIKNEDFETLKKILVKNREIKPVQFSVNNYCLFQSKLTSNGPIYTELQRYELISRNE